MTGSDLVSDLAIITPSRITSKSRYSFASTSLNSLRESLKGLKPSHVVVHDSPKLKNYMPRILGSLSNALKWDGKAKSLYDSQEVAWVIGKGKGSAEAVLEATRAALAEGKIYGFIHLDDHVYCDPFDKLVLSGLEAMRKDENILWTRFSGYPIMHNGRKAFKKDAEGNIIFDDVTLVPSRDNDYTFWSSPLLTKVNNGNYWPVALWFCIYRLEVLEKMLIWAVDANKKHLAHAEEYFKDEEGFNRLINEYPKGVFGYINMQYGGFEMHRNPNWNDLLLMSNSEIR